MLVIGFGRFGQIVSQVLLAQQIDATVIDANARARPPGLALRLPHLFRRRHAPRRAARRRRGAGPIICICVDAKETANRIADLVMSEFPNAKLYVRSWDRAHTLELLAKGVDYELRETYEFGPALRGGNVAWARLRRRRGGRHWWRRSGAAMPTGSPLQRSGDLAAGLPVQPTPEPLSDRSGEATPAAATAQPRLRRSRYDDDLARPAAE